MELGSDHECPPDERHGKEQWWGESLNLIMVISHGHRNLTP
jgi:hypothetical protein